MKTETSDDRRELFKEMAKKLKEHKEKTDAIKAPESLDDIPKVREQLKETHEIAEDIKSLPASMSSPNDRSGPCD